MSLTISELESERAKILDEIENRAQTFSTDGSDNQENLSLKDWLNAAEEVMPASQPGNTMRKKQENRSNYSSKMIKPTKNRASFFGVIIMLSLLLTLLGVLYIAYTSIHKELQSVLETNQKTIEKMTQIQTDMESLQKSISTGGKADLFITLEDKVFALEAQIETLKSQIDSQALSSPVSTAEPSDKVETQQPVAVSDTATNAVTEAVLDEKLKIYTSQLEDRIDQKLEAILNVLSEGKKKFDPASAIVDALPNLSKSKAHIATPAIPEPTIIETKEPVVTQPLVRLVKTVEAPAIPSSPSAEEPIKNFTMDVKWLMSEPELHYTLQLASMEDQDSLEAIAEKKQLKDVRIIPQTRNGITNYILLTGSFMNKADASALAKSIKAESNISPWIRKVKDITARIQ